MNKVFEPEIGTLFHRHISSSSGSNLGTRLILSCTPKIELMILSRFHYVEKSAYCTRSTVGFYHSKFHPLKRIQNYEINHWGDITTYSHATVDSIAEMILWWTNLDILTPPEWFRLVKKTSGRYLLPEANLKLADALLKGIL